MGLYGQPDQSVVPSCTAGLNASAATSATDGSLKPSSFSDASVVLALLANQAGTHCQPCDLRAAGRIDFRLLASP